MPWILTFPESRDSLDVTIAVSDAGDTPVFVDMEAALAAGFRWNIQRPRPIEIAEEQVRELESPRQYGPLMCLSAAAVESKQAHRRGVVPITKEGK